MAISSWVEDALKLKIKDAPLRIKFWNGHQIECSTNPTVTFFLPDPLSLRYLLYPTLLGLAEAYVQGRIQIEGEAMEAVQLLERFSSSTKRLLPIGKSWRPRKRSKKRDTEAVQYHYDISDDFYRHWLDRQMVYSCAYFKKGDEDIHEAQEQKLDHICRKLMLKQGERFLDIGCGWGGLIRWAAKNYGVCSLGITLSRNQYQLARDLIRKDGLKGSCKVLLCDYRDLKETGAFDKIASIGMFEHVGLNNLPDYFKTIFRLLKDGGLVLNHGICSSEPDLRRAGKGDSGKFIDRYVFPYAELPHISRVQQDLARQDLELLDVESLRPHYAKTLRHWLARLEQSQKALESIAGEKRYRIWRAYLAGSAYAFEQGWLTVYQSLVAKRDNLHRWPLPWTRDYLYKER